MIKPIFNIYQRLPDVCQAGTMQRGEGKRPGLNLVQVRRYRRKYLNRATGTA